MPMTPEKERDLVEKMADRFFAVGESGDYEEAMRAALSIAAPILRDEALEEGKAAASRESFTSPEGVDGIVYKMAVRDCIDAIDALKTKDKPE